MNTTNSVLWFNLGMHHIPHTGDLPNTVFSTAHTSMLIEPFNYLAGSPHRATKQMVQLRSSNGTTAITRYGATPANCAVDSVSYFPLFCSSPFPLT